MTHSILASIDDIDSRREACYLLQSLPQRDRIAYLYWLCDRVAILKNQFVTITNESADPQECWLDMCQLISQYGIDPQMALAELERRVSRFKITRSS